MALAPSRTIPSSTGIRSLRSCILSFADHTKAWSGPLDIALSPTTCPRLLMPCAKRFSPERGEVMHHPIFSRPQKRVGLTPGEGRAAIARDLPSVIDCLGGTEVAAER